jgi:rSAM/selenodomain-associated transferase 2
MISVIIPTYNEELVIAEAISALLAQSHRAEIVVVDGGSADATPRIVQGFGDAVRSIVQDPGGPRGRGAAYNQAARAATGDVLLFLHVDSRLPPDGLRLVDEVLADRSVVGGGFLPTFDGAGAGLVRTALNWNERVWRWRTRTFHWFAGDQAPFVRRDRFDAVGGYPTIHLAEDWAFASRLRSLGKLEVIETPVRVSARRFLANGVITTLLVTGSIEAMYRAGVETPILAWWYRRWLPRERG